MKGTTFRTIAASVAILAGTAAIAQANPANSMQPAHVYFGTVQSGSHPNALVTLHNGTGIIQQINKITVAGAGGYVFTLAANTALLEQSGLTRCRIGLILPAGTSCAFDVRVHTSRPGWWRSVLSATYTSGQFNSAELRAHVVAAS